MKNLVIVRHGSYKGKTGHLTKAGKNQIDRLAMFLDLNLEGDFYCLSSDSKRAKESCGRLVSFIGSSRRVEVEHETNSLFLCEKDDLPIEQARNIHEAVIERVNLADNLVLVSHYAVAIDYSKYFMRGEFGKDIRVNSIGTGRAVCIDIEKQSYRLIPPKGFK